MCNVGVDDIGTGDISLLCGEGAVELSYGCYVHVGLVKEYLCDVTDVLYIKLMCCIS